MRLTLFLISLLSIISCSTTKETTKLYGKCEKNYLACSQIEIKPDKTFEYFVFMDVGGQTIRKGTWTEFAGDTILLNTYNQPNNQKTTYKAIINPDWNNKVKISISDFEHKLGGATIGINDGEMIQTADDDGIVFFETNKIKNITYYYMGAISETINISNPHYNEIEILIRDLDLGIVPEYFTNEPIVVTNNKVVFYPYSEERKFEQKRTNNKQKKW